MMSTKDGATQRFAPKQNFIDHESKTKDLWILSSQPQHHDQVTASREPSSERGTFLTPTFAEFSRATCFHSQFQNVKNYKP